MGRLQVYLPDDLHARCKAADLPASELLQGAVRAELARREQLAATERYLDGLRAEGVETTEADRQRAEILARRLLHARH